MAAPLSALMSWSAHEEAGAVPGGAAAPAAAQQQQPTQSRSGGFVPMQLTPLPQSQAPAAAGTASGVSWMLSGAGVAPASTAHWPAVQVQPPSAVNILGPPLQQLQLLPPGAQPERPGAGPSAEQLRMLHAPVQTLAAPAIQHTRPGPPNQFGNGGLHLLPRYPTDTAWLRPQMSREPVSPPADPGWRQPPGGGVYAAPAHGSRPGGGGGARRQGPPGGRPVQRLDQPRSAAQRPTQTTQNIDLVAQTGGEHGVRPARLSCADCLQTAKTQRSLVFLDCTHPRCNMSVRTRMSNGAKFLVHVQDVQNLCTDTVPGDVQDGEPDHGAPHRSGVYSSGRKRIRMCTRCLEGQYNYTPRQLEADKFICPYCKGVGKGKASSHGSRHSGGAGAGQPDGGAAPGASRKRSWGSSQAVSSPTAGGLHRPTSPSLATAVGPSNTGQRKQAAPTPAAAHSRSGDGPRPTGRKRQRSEASRGISNPAAWPRIPQTQLQPPAQPPPSQASESTLQPLRAFLEETSDDRGVCRLPLGALIGALDASHTYRTAAALCGLEHLRKAGEISVVVDEEAVANASPMSILTVRLLALRPSGPKLLGNEKVMVRGPGNLWMAAHVLRVADGRALLRFEGMGSEWDEWRSDKCSSKVVLVESAAKASGRAAQPAAASAQPEPAQDAEAAALLFSSEEEDEDEPEPSQGADESEDAAAAAAAATDPEVLTLGIPSPEAIAAEEAAALAAAVQDLPFPVGTVVEAMDLANKWYAARLVKVDLRKFGNQPRKKRMLVHFVGWGTEWDEWLDLNDETQAERLRALRTTTEFGPYFHTTVTAGSEGYRTRLKRVLEAIGDGQRIGFDSLVRAAYEITVPMRPDEAMKIVRRVAKVLEELREEKAIRWSSPIGFVDIVRMPRDCEHFRPKVGDVVEILDGSMEWFLATVIELPSKREESNDDAGSGKAANVVSVTTAHVGYARCRYVGWSADWDTWVPATSESGDLSRLREKTPGAQKKVKVAAAGGAHLAEGVEAGGDDSDDEEVSFSPNQRDAVFKVSTTAVMPSAHSLTRHLSAFSGGGQHRVCEP